MYRTLVGKYKHPNCVVAFLRWRLAVRMWGRKIVNVERKQKAHYVWKTEIDLLIAFTGNDSVELIFWRKNIKYKPALKFERELNI